MFRMNVLPPFSGRSVSEGINHNNGKEEAFLPRLALRSWSWRQYVLPKCRWTSTKLQDIRPQKIVHFIAVVVRTWHPTRRNCIFLFIINLKDSDSLVVCLRYSSTVKMEAVYSLRTSVNSYQTARSNIQESITNHYLFTSTILSHNL
jgi:hypothetical protein